MPKVKVDVSVALETDVKGFDVVNISVTGWKERVRQELGHQEYVIRLGAGAGPVTPFDGDNEAGVQVFNSAPSLPKAPLP